MPFANPAKPIDYELIGDLVSGGIDYNSVRAACDVALQSTDAAIAALSTKVDTRAAADALAQLRTVVDGLATAAALAAVRVLVEDIHAAVV